MPLKNYSVKGYLRFFKEQSEEASIATKNLLRKINVL